MADFSFSSHYLTRVLVTSHLSYFKSLVTGLFLVSHVPSSHPLYCGYNYLCMKLLLPVNSPETKPDAYRVKRKLLFDRLLASTLRALLIVAFSLHLD